MTFKNHFTNPSVKGESRHLQTDPDRGDPRRIRRRALAGVTAEEAKQLGSNLTPISAEKAGNKDGTIPAYTGGPPSASCLKKGDGIRPDPFAVKVPLYSIDAKSIDKYADN